MQRIYFHDINADHVADILKEMFIERLYDPYLRGRKDLTVLDVGANIGMFSYMIAPYSQIIYALEPAKRHFETLSLMIRDNMLKNVLPVNLGISNACEEKTFYINPGNTTAYSLSEAMKNAPGGTTEKINVVTLENFMNTYDLKTVDILKLDVEGEEAKIFSHESFDRVAPRIKTIFVEYHDWSGVSPDQLKWMLIDRGYKVTQFATQATVYVGER
jgi:FkbM family methyltransferase